MTKASSTRKCGTPGRAKSSRPKATPDTSIASLRKKHEAAMDMAKKRQLLEELRSVGLGSYIKTGPRRRGRK